MVTAKGLIMSQTGLVTFSADFIFGLISRIIGTIIGGALGLCAWYIGAGTGPGNPYGMGAITAVFVLILMYCRLNAPPQFLQGLSKCALEPRSRRYDPRADEFSARWCLVSLFSKFALEYCPGRSPGRAAATMWPRSV